MSIARLTVGATVLLFQYAIRDHPGDSDVSILVEAAVESVRDARAAVEGGAHRLELCADLDAGGTTPSRGVIENVLQHVKVPVLVMIRPRAGDFVYSPAELDRMATDIGDALALGAAGVVFGVLDAQRRVERSALHRLLAAARGKPVTFHRAIDDTPDRLAAVEDLGAAGQWISRAGSGRRWPWRGPTCATRSC